MKNSKDAKLYSFPYVYRNYVKNGCKQASEVSDKSCNVLISPEGVSVRDRKSVV